MICYRCNHEVGASEICPLCGTDLSVFQKVIRISNAYYNDGLQKAEVRNLSGAIVSLQKSLKFNKYNIDARNLLGLVYYEMGEMVDALSEWVISKSYQQDDNVAGRYLENLRANRGQFDAINQTIKKYNQALLYCKQESRDLAIIQLKKVLSLNPKLVKGHQLLALLYLQEDRLEQAKRSLRNAAKIDNNNTTTLRYLKEVNVRLKARNRDKKKKEEDLISYQSGNEMIIMPTRFQDYSLGSTLVYMLIGLIVGAAVIGFLVVPGVESKAKQELKAQLVEANDTITTNAQFMDAMSERIKELEAQVAELEDQADAVPEQTKAYEKLLKAYVAYKDKDIVTAGMNIEDIDKSQLSKSAKETYNAVWKDIKEKYYPQLYSAGYTNYSNGKYKEAIKQLLRVVKHDKSFQNGYAAYYLAQAYRQNGDLKSAKPYYQYVIDNYPNTERAATARNYVNAEE